MGAVITTRAIAESFDNGMEFFSTFGGSTAACVAGRMTLQVTLDEELQRNALLVGERLLSGLKPLMGEFEIVGDVRGSGLFLGVELVRDRHTLEPAPDEATFVVDRMRQRGVLAGTDGPYHNVIKIRGPMPLSHRRRLPTKSWDDTGPPRAPPANGRPEGRTTRQPRILSALVARVGIRRRARPRASMGEGSLQPDAGLLPGCV
jgi:hypothetical protein